MDMFPDPSILTFLTSLIYPQTYERSFWITLYR